MNSGSQELRDLLRTARALAIKAGDITLRHFGDVLDPETKGDGTPVTAADRGAESYLREEIASRYPDHGIVGEEFGISDPGASVVWVLDPIDGTRSFVRGVPLYGVLIGIQVEGVPTVGVAHFPALRETVAAAAGCGCDWNGRPAQVSGITDLSHAAVLATDPADLLDPPLARGWETLVRNSSLARTWGDCYGHLLVATGRAEVMVDPILSHWDSAPFVPILREAGGRFTDMTGEERGDGGSGLSTNGILHEPILAILQG